MSDLGESPSDSAFQEQPESEEGERNELESKLQTPLINPDDPWSLLSAFIVMVGISPIVEEFLFRGVIQQGLVQRLGLLRGVTMVALLWTLLRPAPIAGFTRFVAAAIASFALGWALGIVRIATRSILGSILLAAIWASVGLGSVALEGRMELPGMNIQGTHLPVSVTIASALLVGWAGWTIYQEAVQQFGSEGKSLSTSERPLKTNIIGPFPVSLQGILMSNPIQPLIITLVTFCFVGVSASSVMPRILMPLERRSSRRWRAQTGPIKTSSATRIENPSRHSSFSACVMT